ncbi:unnamed protein product [Cladocopium goreaui]|uniref:Uncharacterized mitochondrial protein AtMg00810 (ORF240b) n=1 Tax=Cladocopium goreaui TaxID=2562237 RepID=A0A9P1CFG9_9DINO|nr:unnamed protein product [Cladocopium goreaui]
MEAKSQEVDAVAEYVELQRLAKMNVLRAANHVDDHRIQKTLTTRFVFDWRFKPYDQSTKRWLRRARLVAREYAFEEGRRDDVFSPEADFQHCPLNPCLARNDKMMLLVHVDNVMLMGDKTYVHEIFLPLLKKKFDLSCELLKDAGDSILFLKRLYTRVDDGIVVKPGNYIQKMLEAFEERFGMVRIQQELNGPDSTTYRPVTGMASYLAQERYDIAYCVKELASKTVKPTILALQRLRKLLGYLKGTQHYALKLTSPVPGVGKLIHSDCEYVLESYSDSDWSGHKSHRFMLFSLLKMRREMEELRENLRVLQTDEIHGINTMGDRMLFQRNLAEVARLNGLSAANRAEGRTEEAFQMFFRLWEGVVRLGGDIESFEDPVNEHERRELFLRNSDIRDGGERRSRHDSPTSRGDLEDEDFAELSPGEAQDGAPQTSPEPEPHGIQNENLPTGYEQDSETQLPLDPEEELQGYADRLDQEVRDLNVM